MAQHAACVADVAARWQRAGLTAEFCVGMGSADWTYQCPVKLKVLTIC